MTVIAADISEFQPLADDSYPRRWLIFRVCDGSYVDKHGAANLAWALRAVADGRMDGFTVYVVYRPGKNTAIMRTLAALPGWHDVMIDVESWPDEHGLPTIIGDHSAEINDLGEEIALAGGQPWIYGNQGDLAGIAPSRKPWPVHVAGYGPTKPDVPNLMGWQYTNGVENHTANPSASDPFGHCDHNELYIDVPAPKPAPDPPTEEDEMKAVIHLVGDGPDGPLPGAPPNSGQQWVFIPEGPSYVPVETDIERGAWVEAGAITPKGDENGCTITGLTHGLLRAKYGVK